MSGNKNLGNVAGVVISNHPPLEADGTTEKRYVLWAKPVNTEPVSYKIHYYDFMQSEWLYFQVADAADLRIIKQLAFGTLNNEEIIVKLDGYASILDKLNQLSLGDNQAGGLSLPAVDIKFVEQLERGSSNEPKFKVYAKVIHPNPSAFAGRKYQVWVYRLKHESSTMTSSGKKHRMAYKRWTHVNEKRELNTELFRSNLYQTVGDETRRTEFDVPYFNKWFELEEFNHYAWFKVRNYETPGEEDLQPGGSNVTTPNHKILAKGRKGKTQPIRFAFALKEETANYGIRFRRGPLSTMFRLGLLKSGTTGYEDIVYGDSYIPMGNDEEYERFKSLYNLREANDSIGESFDI